MKLLILKEKKKNNGARLRNMIDIYTKKYGKYNILCDIVRK